uniref:Uncharacterized protein n=1 Tax=Nelumbo nucifera TaxID=4432 RepID=A0A822ZA12_NELNU|nr:TPA_asm: hypothetical protein HUJ06_009009 [Nelumbo nucifera]
MIFGFNFYNLYQNQGKYLLYKVKMNLDFLVKMEKSYCASHVMNCMTQSS